MDAAFVVLGTLLNLAGAQLVTALKLPLFLDSFGTVISAMWGGVIPGVAVGYLTNVFNSFFDESALYYGLVSVVIAVLVSAFADHGYFKERRTALPCIAVVGVASGALSTIITWMLFGFGFTGGISTPLVMFIYDHVLHVEFAAQLLGDVLVDILDKTIVLSISLLFMRNVPRRLRAFVSFEPWQQEPLSERDRVNVRSAHPRVLSLRTKVVLLISIIMLVVGVVTAMISFALFRSSMEMEQSHYAFGITDVAKKAIDPDRVNAFIAHGEAEPDFQPTEDLLGQIRDSFSNVTYLYVYQIREDGCHVALDPDTAEEQGSAPGDVIPFDEAFREQLPALLAGEQIAPVVSNESYGWLLSVYDPLYDSKGDCVAYVCADVSMDEIMADSNAFLARVVALFLAFFVAICVIVVWLSDFSVILPLNSIALATNGFAFDDEHSREGTVEQMHRLNVRTGDEVENLYQAVVKTAEDTVHYIANAEEQAETIERMQDNLIMVMADLVESRDQFTGDHVIKTAAYTRVIMAQLRRDGVYLDQLTDEFVSDVAHSAPLHDIGKICVPDAILNKPGRLTDEEFEVMKGHTVAGAEILERAKGAVSDPAYLDEAKRLAMSHHEKWNGQGYPQGLAGEDIPLSARIMAVADVFDALVSKRSYKDGFPIEKALDIIREGAGTHFDPQVAGAFLRAEAEVRHIAADHGDDQGQQTFDVHDA